MSFILFQPRYNDIYHYNITQAAFTNINKVLLEQNGYTLVYVLSIFLRYNCWVTATETIWTTKSKVLAIWHFAGKVCLSLSYNFLLMYQRYSSVTKFMEFPCSSNFFSLSLNNALELSRVTPSSFLHFSQYLSLDIDLLTLSRDFTSHFTKKSLLNKNSFKLLPLLLLPLDETKLFKKS